MTYKSIKKIKKNRYKVLNTRIIKNISTILKIEKKIYYK